MKKYLQMSSAAILIGTLWDKSPNMKTAQCANNVYVNELAYYAASPILLVCVLVFEF